MMIGGETEIVEHLDPIFTRLAPGNASASRPLGRESIDTTAEQGYLRCGPSGAGHFVKMVNNGIEYGAIASYAEGLAILRSANVGLKQNLADAETLPYEILSNYQYDFDLRDVAEVWRRGSVISSWFQCPLSCDSTSSKITASAIRARGVSSRDSTLLQMAPESISHRG
jgi:6-phosphogluconate dehydrogenase